MKGREYPVSREGALWREAACERCAERKQSILAARNTFGGTQRAKTRVTEDNAKDLGRDPAEGLRQQARAQVPGDRKALEALKQVVVTLYWSRNRVILFHVLWEAGI